MLQYLPPRLLLGVPKKPSSGDGASPAGNRGWEGMWIPRELLGLFPWSALKRGEFLMGILKGFFWERQGLKHPGINPAQRLEAAVMGSRGWHARIHRRCLLRDGSGWGKETKEPLHPDG